MKLWKIILITAVVAALGYGGWRGVSPSGGKTGDEKGEVLKSRVIREAKHSQRKSMRRVAGQEGVRAGAAAVASTAAGAKGKVDENWDPFSDDKGGFDMNIDFSFAGELSMKEEMSQAVRDILSEIGRAQAKFDKKGVLVSVRKLLAMIAQGHKVSALAKYQAVEAIKLAGGGILETLPELTELAADPNPEVAKISLEAIQEMLWDFDTTPRQIADALAQLVKLTDDVGIINPFVFEMSGMPNSMKVETSLMILDSGNKAAIEALSDNIAFVFDDFDGKIQTREDIVKYGEDNPDAKE